MDAEASERIERAALVELHEAASRETREGLGLRLETVGGALVSIAAAEPSILINRTIGLGRDEPATRESVRRIAELYRAAGIDRFFLHVTADARPTPLRDWLTEEGLVKARGWMKFARGPVPPPEITSDLKVRRIGREHALDFAGIAAAGFDLSEQAVALIAGLVERPDWHLYMSFAGEVPAGTGAMFVRDGCAYLDWGATHPDFRRRGGQSAVLCHRIRDALAMGCRSLITMTGEEVPGDPQHSYRNIQKVGFGEAYLRENWAPPRPDA